MKYPETTSLLSVNGPSRTSGREALRSMTLPLSSLSLFPPTTRVLWSVRQLMYLSRCPHFFGLGSEIFGGLWTQLCWHVDMGLRFSVCPRRRGLIEISFKMAASVSRTGADNDTPEPL